MVLVIGDDIDVGVDGWGGGQAKICRTLSSAVCICIFYPPCFFSCEDGG